MTPVLVEVGNRIEHTGYQICAHETSICMSVFFSSRKYIQCRVHEIVHVFSGPSEKMSVLINFLLQNTYLVSVLSKICPYFVGHI